jgi:RimJ/RimL family protein N-acetyltransferase
MRANVPASASLAHIEGMTDDAVEPWYHFTLPSILETPRLSLRAWDASQTVAMKNAIDANLEHLKRWMPWAMHEPSPLGAIETRLIKFAADFVTGPDWGYAIFQRNAEPMIGSIGVHARIGPRALEIGYWIDRRLTRQGFATEAASVVTHMALALPDVDRVEIRCDPANVASAGVPRRLGFRLVTVLEKNATTPTGEPRDTMVWEMTRTELPAREERSREDTEADEARGEERIALRPRVSG